MWLIGFGIVDRSQMKFPMMSDARGISELQVRNPTILTLVMPEVDQQICDFNFFDSSWRHEIYNWWRSGNILLKKVSYSSNNNNTSYGSTNATTWTCILSGRIIDGGESFNRSGEEGWEGTILDVYQGIDEVSMVVQNAIVKIHGSASPCSHGNISCKNNSRKACSLVSLLFNNNIYIKISRTAWCYNACESQGSNQRMLWEK